MRSLKKIVLIAALSTSILFVNCNKKVETPTNEQVPVEETTQKIADSVKTDTVAPVENKTDSISKK